MIKKLILGLAIIFASQILLANEHEAAPAGKAAGKDTDKKSKAAIYSKHENDLNLQASKITAAETKIRELIEEKNKLTDKEKLKEIVAEIRKNLDERKEAIVKYNKEYHFIKYELPDKGRDFQKKYKRYDENVQKTFEDEVNKKLSDMLGKLNEKYD